MKKPYVIAIPSYKRAKTLKEKTLATLEKYKIDPEIITVFVADQEELDVYKKEFAGTPYESRIVISAPTLHGSRNAISRYYPEGEYIVNLDDDLQEIQKKIGEQTLGPVDDVDAEVFRKGFDALEETGAYLWGIYAAANAFFMKERIATGLYYVIGSCWGHINRHSPDLVLTLEDKEDYERTLQYYEMDGLVARIDNITVKSAYYKEPGGMQETRTSERIKFSADNLVERFPDYCSTYIRETTGHAELRLRGGVKKPKAAVSTLDDFFS